MVPRIPGIAGLKVIQSCFIHQILSNLCYIWQTKFTLCTIWSNNQHQFSGNYLTLTKKFLDSAAELSNFKTKYIDAENQLVNNKLWCWVVHYLEDHNCTSIQYSGGPKVWKIFKPCNPIALYKNYLEWGFLQGNKGILA